MSSEHSDDLVYLVRRAAEERRRETESPSVSTKAAHGKMALSYEDRARHMSQSDAPQA